MHTTGLLPGHARSLAAMQAPSRSLRARDRCVCNSRRCTVVHKGTMAAAHASCPRSTAISLDRTARRARSHGQPTRAQRPAGRVRERASGTTSLRAVVVALQFCSCCVLSCRGVDESHVAAMPVRVPAAALVYGSVDRARRREDDAEMRQQDKRGHHWSSSCRTRSPRLPARQLYTGITLYSCARSHRL